MRDNDSDSDLSIASGTSDMSIFRMFSSDSDSDSDASDDSLPLLPYDIEEDEDDVELDFFMANTWHAPPTPEKEPYHSVPRNKCMTLAGLAAQYTPQTFWNEFRFSHEQMAYLCGTLGVEDFISLPG
jgi:hypothetical protein